jgi:hypothetical protein
VHTVDADEQYTLDVIVASPIIIFRVTGNGGASQSGGAGQEQSKVFHV